jgi:hypothetical protein
VKIAALGIERSIGMIITALGSLENMIDEDGMIGRTMTCKPELIDSAQSGILTAVLLRSFSNSLWKRSFELCKSI